MKSRFKKMVVLGIKQFRDPYYQGFAAQLAFYFILSLIPILVLISQAMGYIFKSSLDDAVGWILQNSKGAMADQLKDIISTKLTGKFTNAVYFFIAIWAASRAQFSMSRITNFMFSEGRNTGKGYWSERFRSLKTVGLTLLVIVLCLVVLVYGGKLLDFITKGETVWLILRWPVALVLFFIMISYNYYVLPTESVRYKAIIPGSFFASVGLLIVTLIYSKYIGSVADYNILYGALANIVALMFWFFFLAWVLMLGVLFNKVWSDINTKPLHKKDMTRNVKE